MSTPSSPRLPGGPGATATATAADRGAAGARALPTNTGPDTWGASAGDALLTALLCVCALTELRTTYTGWLYLAPASIAVVVGIAVGRLTLRLPAAVTALGVVAAYFLVGGAVLAPADTFGGTVPDPAGLRVLALCAVQGWKQLLTTAPPVAASGTLLTVPVILGLAAGAATFTLARRLRFAAAPLPVPAAVLGLCVALGAARPAGAVAIGVLIAALSLGWSAWRTRRGTHASAGGRDHLARAVAAAGVLAVAAAVVLATGPALPGAGGDTRALLRDHVTPPLDLSAYPSPLAGFRKYTRPANQLWDQTLFTVTGLRAGVPVRIATLDDYDGAVWGATNGAGDGDFRSVSSSVPVDGGTGAAASEAQTANVRITIGAAYAAGNDTNPWLPTAGTVTGIEFTGPRAAELTGALRYNTSSSSGIVVTRLRQGDTVSLRTVLPAPPSAADPQPYGRPALTDGYPQVFAARTAAWAKGAVGPGAELRAVAAYFRGSGAYSDGGNGETQYLPGHGIGRLSAFLNGPQPVGDDEQYAAAYALIANSVGMPARVVLGAYPERGGAVKGSDVRAWVELRTGPDTWTPVPDSRFVPDRSKKPDQQPPRQTKNADAAPVPPPNAVHRPESGADAGDQPGSGRGGGLQGGSVWDGLLRVLADGLRVLSPLFAAACLLGVVGGLKARRRRLRRTRPLTANRFAAGWDELLDQARDLGVAVAPGTSRTHQAALLAELAPAGAAVPGQTVRALAHTADAAVYGPAEPTPEDAAAYWRQIDAVRHALRSAHSRTRRLRALADVRTLRRPGRPAAGRPRQPVAPGPRPAAQ